MNFDVLVTFVALFYGVVCIASVGQLICIKSEQFAYKIYDVIPLNNNRCIQIILLIMLTQAQQNVCIKMTPFGPLNNTSTVNVNLCLNNKTLLML